MWLNKGGTCIDYPMKRCRCTVQLFSHCSSRCRTNLLEALLGNLSTKMICLGILYFAKYFSAYACTLSSAHPSPFATTKATGTLPQVSSCLPTTPTSRIQSISERTFSISDG